MKFEINGGINMREYGVAYGDNACLHVNYRFSKPLVRSCDTKDEAIKVAENMNGVPFANIAARTEVDMAYVVANII